MQEKAVQYVHEALTASGFALVDAGTAHRAAPHLWASAQGCGLDFGRDLKTLQTIAERRGAKLLQVLIDGRGPVPLLTMSEDQLAARILWITGKVATAIRPLAEPAPVLAPAKASAKDEPPNYACNARKEWFLARGLKDPNEPERWPAKRAEIDVPRGR